MAAKLAIRSPLGCVSSRLVVEDGVAGEGGHGGLLGAGESGAVEVEDQVMGEDRAESACQMPVVVEAGKGLAAVVEGCDPFVVLG